MESFGYIPSSSPQQGYKESTQQYGDLEIEDERGSTHTKSQSSNIDGKRVEKGKRKLDDIETYFAPRTKLKRVEKGKRKLDDIETYFAPRTKPGSQPSIKFALASKEVVHRADMALAQWFFDSCIPMNVLNSPFAQKAIDAIAAIGPGYQLPSYYRMRVNLLRDCKEECKCLVDRYRRCWEETGCTLMADGWTDNRSRTLINFLVYCPRGLSFIKSVDASDIKKDPSTLCSLFAEVVEWVGPENIVQLVTDNATNYKKAGELLHKKYGNIYWSPCAAHCLNLILKDIGSMPHVQDLARSASKVTIFIYNNVFILSWLRKRPGWKEIVRPGVTRFATTFITLKSIHEHKHDLQAFATSKYYIDSKLSKSIKGKEASSIILDTKFWNNCQIMSKLAGPLIRLLRVVDSNEKPSLGYLYDGMYKTRKAIKNMFRNTKRLYRPYTTIIKRRWDTQLRQGIHSAAYFLNPRFQYDQVNYCNKPEVMQGLVEVIGNKDICNKPKFVMNELRIFQDALESFGKPLALTMSKEMQPDEWWKIFGSSVPNLQKLAIRILSQTSSSSGCERNWSVFEQIHTKRRNHLEHQRLNDLVYVRYNLNLRNRLHLKRKSYDPLDYTSLETIDFWIVDDDPTPELDYEDLENEIYRDEAIPIAEETAITCNRQPNNEDECGVTTDEILEHDNLEAFGDATFQVLDFGKPMFGQGTLGDEF